MIFPKVIAALWDASKNIDLVNVPYVSVVFLLNCDLISLQGYTKQLKRWKKKVFVDLDFVQGLTGEEYSVRYVSLCGVDGIITIKPRVIEIARKLGITTVLRSFILDSNSISRLDETLRTLRPDYLEVLPGCTFPKVSKALAERSDHDRPKLIGAGLIETTEEASSILKMGAVAVSSSQTTLWRMNHA